MMKVGMLYAEIKIQKHQWELIYNQRNITIVKSYYEGNWELPSRQSGQTSILISSTLEIS